VSDVLSTMRVLDIEFTEIYLLNSNNCDEVLDALKETNITQKKLEHIRNITPDNFEGKDLQLISSSLRKYTNAYENKNGEKVPIGKILMGLLKC
jgi:hypothetical protein